jgi:mRNA-degrading endonuclease toxin of MazEF toxin-antitoxin module
MCFELIEPMTTPYPFYDKGRLLDEWHPEKIRVNAHCSAPKSFKNSDIWWCIIGINIGCEVDGKQHHARPVLIIKRFGKSSFFGLPLTSQIKAEPWAIPINIIYKQTTAPEKLKSYCLLTQGRTFDSRRLTTKIGTLSTREFEQVKQSFSQLVLA